MGLLEELNEKRAAWQCNLELCTQRMCDERDNLERATAMLADIDRAIAALTPPAQAVEAEPAIPEGFTKWVGGERPVGADVRVEVILQDYEGTTKLDALSLNWSGDWETDDEADPPTAVAPVRAYRIISEPAAGEGDEDGESVFVQPAMSDFSRGAADAIDGEARAEDETEEYYTGYDATTESLEGPVPRDEPVTPPDAEPAPEPFDYFPTQPFTIGASAKHADESAALAPLLPPEPPKPATPEEMMACGVIVGEAYGLWRERAKENA